MKKNLLTKSFTATAALVLLTAISCGKKAEAPVEENIVPAKDETEQIEIIKNALVTCEDKTDENCSESVALVVMKLDENSASQYSHKGVGQCTGFLISSDLLLTNSHCIPEKLKPENSDCSKHIEILFPETNTKNSERAKCQRVIKASNIGAMSALTARLGKNDSVNSPDYALLKLDRQVERKVLTLSRVGVKDNEEIKSISIDPSSRTSIQGIVRQKNCTARQNSEMAPDFIADHSPIIGATECDVISGNSGSPVLNQSGEVVAIVHASMHMSDEMRLQFHESMINNRRSLPLDFISDWALFTSISCVDLPGFQISPIPMQCQVQNKKNALLFNIKNEIQNVTIAKPNLDDFAARIAPSLPSDFKYRSDYGGMQPQSLKTDSKAIPYVLLLPKCFAGNLIIDENTALVEGTKDAPIVVMRKLTLPVIQNTGVSYDRYIRPTINAHIASTLEMNVQFNVEELTQVGRTEASGEVILPSGQKMDLSENDKTLRLCGDTD